MPLETQKTSALQTKKKNVSISSAAARHAPGLAYLTLQTARRHAEVHEGDTRAQIGREETRGIACAQEDEELWREIDVLVACKESIAERVASVYMQVSCALVFN